jgi:hypothetical protein
MQNAGGSAKILVPLWTFAGLVRSQCFSAKVVSKDPCFYTPRVFLLPSMRAVWTSLLDVSQMCKT